ncbi:4Fe-4S single cluster domain-containing protein [Methanococcoides alaskense]|uniref:Anaerobic ribonucleoside-triphosphate reductase activating protein n=1 Tax=Methanococcoides alaskense TaxID=325778 RepID=A0AA90Z5S1_9EURY|nr:4Fe-4S single cluster domain-containing protein [Methanococcoides alaskense]MDA0525437.1 4Fe-4S single cluster domain-containing protein [Methanococcoides alaskense]MDR6221630.1 anaerobic ribonucleoside-triphosphate reductase activating protein [Methanococcoides alaskense]
MQEHGTCFNIAHIEHGSEIYGPGKRFVIWFQGCSLACPGCWNKSMWSFEPCNLVEREKLLHEILAYSELDGLTVLGGEPLEQAHNLYWLLTSLQEKNVSVMLYTGYQMDEIKNDNLKSKICEMADILVSGRYKEDERDLNLKWRGSRNQILLVQNEIYNDLDLDDGTNQVEITIDEFGTINVLGYPDDDLCSIL